MILFFFFFFLKLLLKFCFLRIFWLIYFEYKYLYFVKLNWEKVWWGVTKRWRHYLYILSFGSWLRYRLFFHCNLMFFGPSSVLILKLRVFLFLFFVWWFIPEIYIPDSAMGASRKLQGEIDRVLKKVQEGVDVFDSIWNKVRFHHTLSRFREWSWASNFGAPSSYLFLCASLLGLWYRQFQSEGEVRGGFEEGDKEASEVQGPN